MSDIKSQNSATCPYCDFIITNNIDNHYSNCKSCPIEINNFCIKYDIDVKYQHQLNSQKRSTWIDYMQEKILSTKMTGLIYLPISVWLLFK